MAASGLSCGSSLAKYFLFVFNIIFWLIGACILGVGIWVLVDDNALELIHIATVDSSDSLGRGAAYTLIAVGIFVFITGFVGCCGAIKESSSLLLIYAIIVGLIVFLQFVAGILAAVFKDQIMDELEDSMVKTVDERYGQPDYEGTTEAWDFMQREFECCGAKYGPKEWMDTEWHKNHTEPVPLTCCVLTNGKKINEDPIALNATLCYKYALDYNNTMAEEYVHIEGCKPQLEDWLKNHAGILIGVAFGLAFVQVAGVVISCCLRRSILSLYEYV